MTRGERSSFRETESLRAVPARAADALSSMFRPRAVSKAASAAAAALQSELTDVLARINEEIGKLQTAMQAGVSAYTSQANAISNAAERTRETAETFASIATQVRSASAPLIQGSERIASASADLRAAVDRSTDELQRAGAASSELAQSLSEQVTRISQTWDKYREQFDKKPIKSLHLLTGSIRNPILWEIRNGYEHPYHSSVRDCSARSGIACQSRGAETDRPASRRSPGASHAGAARRQVGHVHDA